MVWSYWTIIVSTLCNSLLYGIWHAMYLPWYCVHQQGLLICNTLDVMQCEKNITKSLMKTLFGKKDTLKVRMDLKEANIRPHLWPIPGRNQKTWLCRKPHMCSQRTRRRYLWMLCGNQKLQPTMWTNCGKEFTWWDIERIEIPRLSCLYATSFAPLCTHNHEIKCATMYNKTKPHIQTGMR